MAFTALATSTPLYAGAVAALAAGRLPETVPTRRSVRRGTTPDVVNEGDEDFFAVSTQAASSRPRRRRAPIGTLNQ